MKRLILALLILLIVCPAFAEQPIEAEQPAIVVDDVTLSDDASDFVLLSEAVPDSILEIRYYSTYNFVGDRIDGYEEPLAFLTKEAAKALKEVSDELIEKGYRLKIYDAYRPQMAVTHFANWAMNPDDTRMKDYFYPELDKEVLFPQGYIAAHSGHSRGSTVDLTLFDMTTEKEVDMGGTFDYFGELSHPDYTGITDEQYANRMLLRDAMTAHGFKPLAEEWWHFTLENEPYPDTYFTFPINSESVLTMVSGASTEQTATVDGVGEHVTVTLTMADGRITGVKASSDNTEADERGKEALSLIADAIVAKNGFDVEAISGATCTSNAVIAGAIEAWMQIKTAEMSQEDWMEPLLGGWENYLHEAAELPADAQAAFDKAAAEFTPVALLSTQLVAGMNYCILCQTPEGTWALVYIYADLEGNAEVTNVYELYIERHSTAE